MNARHWLLRSVRVGIAVLLIGWALRRLWRYRCMVPWQGGVDHEPLLFVAAAIAFACGFVAIVAEVTLHATRSRGGPLVRSAAGIGLGLLLYAAIGVLVYALDPSDRYHGSPYYRDRLALAWPAGLLEEFEHYDTPECGY